MSEKERLFGTDGVRGRANQHPMTAEMALALGQAVAHVFASGGGGQRREIIIGKDTRLSGYLFETTFQKEVFSDLTGERGVLMGAIYGLWLAQYEVLRAKGHSPSEAFNETVEELTQSLMPLVAENGMDWMYANTSTTAQRGALDWRHKFRDAVAPLFEQLYESVATGEEARIVIEAGSKKDYRARLEKELADLADEEIWRAGKAVRALRPESQKG